MNRTIRRPRASHVISSAQDRARPAIVPVIGAVLCLGLATFQAFAVPEAGTVVLTWLALGAALGG